MERITEIAQLKPGDRIFTVDGGGDWQIIEFREIHPHHDGYSLFLNENQDGMKKFYNKDLTKQEWYRYDGSDECWRFIGEERIKRYQKTIEHIAKGHKMKVPTFNPLVQL